MIDKFALVFLAIILGFTGGCTRSSGIMQMGNNSYSITTNGPAADAKRQAYDEALTRCKIEGKEIRISNEHMTIRNVFGDGTYEIIFQCFDKSNMDMQTSPVYQKEPDVLIEDKRR